MTKYGMYSQPEQTIDEDTSGTPIRTTTIGYDAAGRQTSQSVSSSVGTATPDVTTSYYSTTGLPDQTSTSSPSQTITRVYDGLGRMTSYTDADSNTSTYQYDLLDRVTQIYDGKADINYSYDDVGGEERGLPTTIDYGSGIGTFTAAYDPDGNVLTQTYPNGGSGTPLTATYTYDAAGEATSLAYTKGSGTWPDSSARYNIHGEKSAMTSDLWAYNYTYDNAGRLTATDELNTYGCLSRDYYFDADSNRVQLTTKTASAANCPATSVLSNAYNYYDAADRIINSGYTYDTLGRTTAMSAGTSPNGYATTLGYYTNDLVHTITSGSGSVTTTYNIDPNQRVDTFSASGTTRTNHYVGDNDTPAWVSENAGGTSWTRYLDGFNSMATSVNQAGTVILELINLHGDIIGPSATGDTTWNLSATQTETDEYGLTETGTTNRYDYLGSDQRKRDVSGVQLMGARVYNPDTGRFLQTDPVLGGSANNYDYAGGDPVNGLDLSGRGGCGACGASHNPCFYHHLPGCPAPPPCVDLCSFFSAIARWTPRVLAAVYHAAVNIISNVVYDLEDVVLAIWLVLVFISALFGSKR